MLLLHGFRRLSLAERPTKTALTLNSIASPREHRGRIFRLEVRRTLCLPGFAQSGL
jgi:hypothetical protein